MYKLAKGISKTINDLLINIPAPKAILANMPEKCQ